MKAKILIVIAILALVAFKPAPKRSTIFTIGDSTMANKVEKAFPETGWGQMLYELFDTTKVEIQNHAVNGRSSKSFIGEGRWDKVFGQLKPGDFVFIQFGHNDQKDQSPDRFTNPYTGYRQNLRMYVNKSREKGAIPVLFTSIVRRNFNEKGVLIDTHGAYPEVVRSVARELDVPLIDMQIFTEELVLEKGVEGSKAIYMNLKPGEYPNFPEGKEDNTHLNREGATLIASMAIEQFVEKFPKMKSCLKK